MFPKAWKKEAWAECPYCGFILKTQEEHPCGDFIYSLSFSVFSITKGQRLQQNEALRKKRDKVHE